MAVVSSYRSFGNASCDVDEKGQRKHTLTWQVKVDNVTHTGFQVVDWATSATPDATPALYDQMPGDSAARCKSVSAKQSSDSPLYWEVTANYDTSLQFAEPQPENPLSRLPIYAVEFSQFTRIVERDTSGNPITNTAGDVFEPGVTQEDSRPVLVVTKNLATLGEVVSLMLLYKDAVNSAPFYGAGIRQAKIKSITSGPQQTENGFQFYPVTIKIEFKGNDDPDGPTWDKHILNTGMRWKRVNVLDAALNGKFSDVDPFLGGKVTKPICLKEDGSPCARDANLRPIDPHYVVYRTYPERNFSSLNI